MKHMNPEFNEDSPVEKAAADWMLRMDRGLTPEEQDQYTDWLAEDPSHREAMVLYEWGWDEFDRLAGLQTTYHAQVDPDLLAPGNEFAPETNAKHNLIRWFAAVPIAAALALTIYMAWPNTEPAELEVKPALELMARIEQRTLDDGSRIEINRGAEVEVAYTVEERRVYLIKGEANFDVAKDVNRPFIVNVAGIDIRAVGTIFSVKLSDDAVEVLVTEGKVNVKPVTSVFDSEQPIADSYLEIGQRAKVNLGTESLVVEVTTIDEVEIEKATRWQPRLLDFDSAPLGDIVAEFNRRNPIQVVLADPSLEMVRLSNLFWSDNVEGFVRLMESSFGMEAEWRGSLEIVLRDAATNAH
jgi:transmembrane sensor